MIDRRLLLRCLLIAFAVMSLGVLMLVRDQAPGADYSCFWAGGQAAMNALPRLYDFAFVTELQGWPLGPDALRPYIYPPSALFLFVPFALPPYWVGYGLWVLSTGVLYWWAGRRAGAPSWMLLIPSVAFVAYCGQVTFLIGGLGLAGLALRERKILAGVLFGVAAAIKPQFFVLLPVALLAERRWATVMSTGFTAGVLCLLSLFAWGVQPWFDWVDALGRFSRVIFDNPSLLEDVITPYGLLLSFGLDPRWAFGLIPVTAAMVWFTFRNESSAADRSIALFGCALLISPYAMNYETALLAPALAVYLARTKDRAWLAYFVASLVYVLTIPVVSILAILLLPLVRAVGAKSMARADSA